MELVTRGARRIVSIAVRVIGARPRRRHPTTNRAAPVEGHSRRRAWAAGSALLLTLGVLAALVGATELAHNATARARDGFRSASTQIASTLQLAIQHEEDLVVAARAFVVGDTNGTPSAFRRWTTSVDALKRYPELVSISHIVVVPAAALPAFEAQARRSGAPGAQNFTVIPPGKRAFYCLIAATVASTHTSATFPPGTDVCAIDPVATRAGFGARDSGRTAYAPLAFGANKWMLVFTPVYRGGTSPATVAARRRAFLGWVVTAIVPQAVLGRALLGHTGYAVVLRYHDPTSAVTFRSGSPHGSARSTVDLHNGWTVETSGAIAAGGVLANADALTVLLAGIVVSVLLSALVLVLATGRARATQLAALRTGELRHQALHDSLTGLPNRALITDRAEQLLARHRRAGTAAAALFIDLDDFKNVNDSLGHAAGDRLLQAVAKRLTASLRDADTVGRMGGDEFVVLIEGGNPAAAPALVAERVLAVLRQPFEIAGSPTSLTVGASIGVAVGDRPAAGDLLRDADVALYQAKDAGKNCYALFNAEMESDLQHRVGLEFDLRSALQGGQFRLVYQPIYALEDLSLVGAEALLRWEHPVLGTIEPDEFIPLLESSGQIIPVGCWVLEEACAQMATWRDRGSDLGISVNVSGRQLDRDDFIADVRNALAHSGLNPTALTVEVTETALMRDTTRTAAQLRAIRALGVHVAIDDFGTGYSSLAYLQQLPVDSLKIDRVFTNAIARSADSRALIHTLVELGKALGLKTLAEGVETTDQIDQLRNEHVTQAQGFLFSRPLDADALEAQILVPARPQSSTAQPRSPDAQLL